MKTTIRITLAKWQRVRANYIKIPGDSKRKGPGVPCVVQMRIVIDNSLTAFGLAACAQQKTEVVTSGAGTTGYAK